MFDAMMIAAGLVTLADITSVDWQFRLSVLGDVVEGADDVAQCIRTILMTPKGTVPHAPDFGSNLHLYLDWPLQSGRPQIIRETIDAIAANEPRVKIVRVSVDAASPDDPALMAAIILELEWTLLGTNTGTTAQIAIGRAA
jgi:uncharacterized protein